MATRQPKKKRTRERTVTTLTDATEGSLQMSGEERNVLVSAPPTSFSLPPTILSMPPIPPSVSNPFPSGRSDLEILEDLKNIIKSNQHPSFRPIPKPAALASIYRGPLTFANVPPHPEQIPEDYKPLSNRVELEGRPSDLEGRVRKGDNSGYHSQSELDSNGKPMDMDPPGLNAPLLADGGQRPPQYGQPLSRVPTDKSLQSSGYQSKTSSYDSRDFRRDPPWPRRSSNASQDDPKSARFDSDRNGSIRYPPDNRPGRFTRDYDRDKDRERERDRRGTDFANRYERPRYTDNRRPYEPRGAPPPRSNDSKSSVDAPPLSSRPLDDRTMPDSRAARLPSDDRPFDSRRPLNDDRVSEPRRPIDDRPIDSRGSRPYWEDRQVETRDSRPEERSLESRLSRPPAEDRYFNGRPPPPDLRDRRPLPPSGERLAKPSLMDDQVAKGPPDERLPLTDRAVRPDDDRRPPVLNESQNSTPSSGYSRTAPPTANSTVPPQPSPRLSGPTSIAPTDATPRPIDDRRPPAPSTVERTLPPSDRPAIASAALADRAGRPTDERRSPDDYPSRAPVGTLGTPPESRSLDRVAPRPIPSQDARAIPRPPGLNSGSHEDRNGRTPSLQERISGRPGEPPLARPAGDDRAPTPLDRLRPAPDTTATTRTSSDPSQPPVKPTDVRPSAVPPALSDRIQRPDDRGRPPTNDRTGPPPPRYYSKPRPLSPPRDDGPRAFKPRGNTVSPKRPEYRPVDRTYPDRYERERSPERRPDTLDVDRRFDSRPPAGYRRPSPPPFNRDRTWTDNFANDTSRRHPADAPPHTYAREWREDDRPAPGASFEDWERGRDWDRSRPPPSDRVRDYERDTRFADPSWETREERERRVGGTFPPPSASNVADPPPPRPYETRPLSQRLSDGYPPPEDRERDRAYDRSRYHPMDANPAGYSRVRPRSPSPSPIRRPGAVDELNRPPLKRVRDDAYGPSGYYSTPPPGSIDPPRDYPPSRMRTPPPGPPGPYYDDARDYPPRGVSPAGSVRDRERDFPERDGYSTYDRRDPPLARMPPPRASPSYNRPPYQRDDRRYARP